MDPAPKFEPTTRVELSGTSLTHAVIFPWSAADYIQLTANYSETKSADYESRWKTVIKSYRGLSAVAGRGTIYMLHAHTGQSPLVVAQIRLCLRHDITALAWSILPQTMDPILLFASNHVLYVWDISTNTRRSALAGHGAAITSLAVPKGMPTIVASASRDFTIRIWDLCAKDESHLPASPPFYSRCIGPGSCVRILHGNFSGGHSAPVMHVDFHPALPLLASAGLDRAVKIWSIHSEFGVKTHRDASGRSQRRPLFSSTRMHPSGLCAVKWLSQDVLATQSIPMHTSRIAKADALVRLWRWLGYPRMRDALANNMNLELFGSIGDYKDSGSFLTLGSLVPPDVEGFKRFLVEGIPPTIILPQRSGFVYVKLSMASHFGIEDQEDSPEGRMVYQSLHGDKTQYCAVSPEGEVIMGGKDNIQWWSRTKSPLCHIKT